MNPERFLAANDPHFKEGIDAGETSLVLRKSLRKEDAAQAETWEQQISSLQAERAELAKQAKAKKHDPEFQERMRNLKQELKDLKQQRLEASVSALLSRLQKLEQRTFDVNSKQRDKFAPYFRTQVIEHAVLDIHNKELVTELIGRSIKSEIAFHREQGRTEQAESLERILHQGTPEQRQQINEFGESAIRDMAATQKQRLNEWFNYVVGDPKHQAAHPRNEAYPIWFKYWVFSNLTKLQDVQDPETGEYQKRKFDTLKTFPELNEEALATTLRQVQEVIDNDQNTVDPQSISFAKIYGAAIQKFHETSGS